MRCAFAASPSASLQRATVRRPKDRGGFDFAGLVQAHDLPGGAFGASRSLQLPGFSVAVGEMAAAVRRAGGVAAYARIHWEPDPQIQQIISSWPQALQARRAEALGFTTDSGIDEVVEAFIDDDLETQRQLV